MHRFILLSLLKIGIVVFGFIIHRIKIGGVLNIYLIFTMNVIYRYGGGTKYTF